MPLLFGEYIRNYQAVIIKRFLLEDYLITKNVRENSELNHDGTSISKKLFQGNYIDLMC